MRKFNIKVLSSIAIITILSSQTALAAFIDLNQSHTNYDAITYLEENNILNGYPDGTFKPDNSVNRAEFLKIILEGSSITLDETENTPFSDVNHSAWYAEYIKKAYKEGWVVGYSDGTFRPEQTINKVEALKILGEVQAWQLETMPSDHPFDDVFKAAWYATYVSYAKERNYLEETSGNFFPGDLMSRAKISEIIYRTLISNGSSYNTPEAKIARTPEDPKIQTSPDFKEIVMINTIVSTDFYDNITLDEVLPGQFFLDEVYMIEGSSSADSVTITLEKSDHSDFEVFTEEVENNHFEISVFFKESGSFILGIAPEKSGQIKAAQIEVNSNLPSESNPDTAVLSTNLDIEYRDNTTFARFTAADSTIKKLVFNQGSKEVRYISRQDTDRIPIQYRDFKNFSTGNTSFHIETAKLNSYIPLEISSAFSTNPGPDFIATEHSYDFVNNDSITINPPDTLNSTSEFSISATVKTETSQKGYVIRPDGFVDEVNIISSGETSDYYGQEVLNSGSEITFTYDPETSGRYIIEINNKEGGAIVNHPIYIGNKTPLIPDFFDLNTREFFSGDFDVKEFRIELLDRINSARTNHGLEEIEIIYELNTLAQNHSNDMADNDFFGHVNQDEQTPDDRRTEAGILTSVSENIARDTAIIFAHNGLMRSGAHRNNILNPEWETVGLGIAVDGDYIIIAEEFSTKTITNAELTSHKNDLFKAINEERVTNNLSELSYSSDIENASKYLNDQLINNGATINKTIFTEALEQNNISGKSQVIGSSFNLWETILDSIIYEKPVILDADWESTGIDIQLDSTGNIYTMFILNQP